MAEQLWEGLRLQWQKEEWGFRGGPWMATIAPEGSTSRSFSTILDRIGGVVPLELPQEAEHDVKHDNVPFSHMTF